MKKLSDLLKEINSAEAMPKFELPQYNEGDIIQAFMSEKPDVELRDVFGDEFWPKVQRWLNIELKDVKVDKGANNLVGGPLRAKLDIYLEKDDSTTYPENVKALARALQNSYKKWNEKEIKDKDLPHTEVV